MVDQASSQTTSQTSNGVSVDGLPAWQLARREQIVRAALGALEEQEYERIQIRDVAADAGVALGTLYRYFSSKEHLYAAVLGEWAAFEKARPRRSSRLAPAERVRHRVHAVLRAFAAQPQFFKVHVLLQASGDANARALLVRFNQVAHESLAAEFDLWPPDEAQDVSIMLWSIINSMVTQVVYQGGVMPQVYQVVDRFIDLLVPRMEELEHQV
ncbi:TetR/AcrR family transcriptional regulator [Spongisporangium articulatum]|uniref:TetR/AcrR family transcriptional regulator n=1 Tax=Spongisporangium articulatum TaxID=3362603 RepID=A0ABW8AVQ9_9ACTN